LLKNYKLKNSIELYQLIANDKIDIQEVKKILKSSKVDAKEKAAVLLTEPEKLKADKIREDVLVIDKSLDKVDYKFARCCNPIFGDEVFGFVTMIFFTRSESSPTTLFQAFLPASRTWFSWHQQTGRDSAS